MAPPQPRPQRAIDIVMFFEHTSPDGPVLPGDVALLILQRQCGTEASQA